MPKLLVIRGAPGSGKSTIAQYLMRPAQGWAEGSLYDRHYEADHYYTKQGQYQWCPEEIPNAHMWCRINAEKSLRDGHDVVVSNTATTEKEVEPYRELAKKYNAEYQEMVLLETPYKNHHKVPEEKVEEYKRRLRESLSMRG
jgi:predicted kinase